MVEVTEEQSDSFHRDGAVLLRGVLEDAWLERLAKGLDAIYAAPDVLSENLGTLRVDQFPASRSADLQALLDSSPIAALVGSALRSPVRFYMDQSFVKPPGRFLPTPWHQDTCYYNLGGQDLIRAWVCCDPVPREASLEIVRGSHRWDQRYKAVTPNYDPYMMDSDLPASPNFGEQREEVELLGWDMEPGDVLLFGPVVCHGSDGNASSAQDRRALAFRYCGGDVTFAPRHATMPLLFSLVPYCCWS